MRRYLAFAPLALGLTAFGHAATTLVVHGGQSGHGATAIVVPIEGDKLFPGPFLLTPSQGGEAFPALVFDDERGKRSLATVLPKVAPGEQRYTLRAGASKENGVAIAQTDKSPNLAITLGGKPFATLVLNEATKPYVYPLIGPTGAPITRAHPMGSVEGEDRDHHHQRSFWFTHGDVNGYDFWGSDPLNKPLERSGRIKPTFTQVKAGAEGSGVVQIDSKNDWLGPDGKRVCQDERVLRFYASQSPRIIDVDITIKASDGPVTFGDTKEGMFGLRLASTMDVKRKLGGKITNAEGVTDNAAWGKASPWVDYTGPVDGKTVGVAILNHPDSFRFPTTWHVRDYGLFAANPFGYHDFGMKTRGDHTIPAGGSIHFGYRVILHEGDTASARIADAFETYAHPPRAELRSE